MDECEVVKQCWSIILSKKNIILIIKVIIWVKLEVLNLMDWIELQTGNYPINMLSVMCMQWFEIIIVRKKKQDEYFSVCRFTYVINQSVN